MLVTMWSGPAPWGSSWHTTPWAHLCRPQVIKNSDILNPVYPSTRTTQHDHPAIEEHLSRKIKNRFALALLYSSILIMIWNCVFNVQIRLKQTRAVDIFNCQNAGLCCPQLSGLLTDEVVCSNSPAERKSWQIRRYENVTMSLASSLPPPSVSHTHSLNINTCVIAFFKMFYGKFGVTLVWDGV